VHQKNNLVMWRRVLYFAVFIPIWLFGLLNWWYL
jgi:hypothetical protein